MTPKSSARISLQVMTLRTNALSGRLRSGKSRPMKTEEVARLRRAAERGNRHEQKQT